MSWTKKYHYYLIFGDIAKDSGPWINDGWAKIHPFFDKILKSSNHFKETGLGTVQYARNPKAQYYNVMKFGKLSWNEQSHQKWTLLKSTEERLFAHLDAWTPRRTVCATLNTAPDIFFSIGNQRHTYKEKSQFDFLISIAVADSLNFDAKNEVIEISKLVNAKRAVYKQRQWNGKKETAEPVTWEFINSIQDIVATFGIYKAGPTLNIHDTKFEDLKFEPYWETIYCH